MTMQRATKSGTSILSVSIHSAANLLKASNASFSPTEQFVVTLLAGVVIDCSDI